MMRVGLCALGVSFLLLSPAAVAQQGIQPVRFEESLDRRVKISSSASEIIGMEALPIGGSAIRRHLWVWFPRQFEGRIEVEMVSASGLYEAFGTTVANVGGGWHPVPLVSNNVKAAQARESGKKIGSVATRVTGVPAKPGPRAMFVAGWSMDAVTPPKSRVVRASMSPPTSPQRLDAAWREGRAPTFTACQRLTDKENPKAFRWTCDLPFPPPESPQGAVFLWRPYEQGNNPNPGSMKLG